MNIASMIFAYRRSIPVVAVASMFALIWPAYSDAGDGCDESRLDPVMQAYCTVKDYESYFEVPTPVGEILVGTFNAANGSFNGLASSVIQPGDGVKTRITVPARASINAVNVRVKFRITNPRGPITLSVNGKNYSRGTAGTLFADIGEAHEAKWSIRSGPSRVSGRLTIDRPPVIGVGAFTLPVLPLAVLYEPPQDNQARNKAKFEQTHVVTSTFSMEFSDFESTTRPAKASFSSLMEFKDVLGALKFTATKAADAGKAAKSPELQAAGKASEHVANALGFIMDGLGNNLATLTRGEQNVRSESIEFTMAQTEAYETNEQKGPGLGDRFIILRNVRFLWVVNGKKIQLTMLGYEQKAAPSARALRESRSTGWFGLDTKAINALLTVSPTTQAAATMGVSSGRVMSAGPAMQAVAMSTYTPRANRTIYDPKRFLFLGSHHIGSSGDGPNQSYTSSLENSVTETSSTSTFSLRTESFEKGWLSYVGLGVPETKDVEAKTTYTRTESQKVSDIVRSHVDFYAEEGEDYGIRIYLDQAFGTLAFEEYDLSTSSRVTGTAQDQNGKPIANQTVLAVVDGERYHTQTDGNGQYTLALDPGHQGTVQITAGNAQGSVQFKGAPISNVYLRPTVITPALQSTSIRATHVGKKPAASEPEPKTEPTPKQPSRISIPTKRLEKKPPKRN